MAYDEERVARELEAWFAQRAFERWPTYRTFVADGRKRLYEAVLATGGSRRWAPELGVPPASPARTTPWGDAEIRAALRVLLREHRPERFPSRTWLARHGPRGLAAGVQRSGGARRWAPAFGMRVAPPWSTRWSDEEIASRLRRLLAEHELQRFPSGAWLQQYAPPGLALAIKRSGGLLHWSRELGVLAPLGTRWTDEHLDAELRAVCAGMTQWPTPREFKAAGATRVLAAVYTGHGVQWWARRLGLQADKTRPRRASADGDPRGRS